MGNSFEMGWTESHSDGTLGRLLDEARNNKLSAERYLGTCPPDVSPGIRQLALQQQQQQQEQLESLYEGIPVDPADIPRLLDVHTKLGTRVVDLLGRL